MATSSPSVAMSDVLDSLPSAIDAPFDLTEYEGRMETIRAAMAQAGVDCLFLSAPESLHYISGYACEWYQANSPEEWLPASGIAIHVDHDDFIHFEHVQEATLIRLTCISRDVRLTEAEGTQQQDFIVDELAASGWLNGSVGLEMSCYRPPRTASESFQRRLEARVTRDVDATSIVRSVRRYKSPREMSYIREAQRIADIGMAAAGETIRPGATELEVYGEMINAMARAGGEVAAIPCPVVSGPRASTVHGLAGRRVIQNGDLVNVDLSGVYNRYHANLARCFSLGEPAPAVRRAIEGVYGAVAVAADVIRPNLPVRDFLARLEDYYRSVGLFGHEWWVGGYELGVAFPPDWVGGFMYSMGEDAGDEVFAPGEALNFEANFYLPDAAGIAFAINTMVFEKDRAEFIFTTPAELTVIEEA